MFVVDLPFGLEDLDKIFVISNFLENREALVEKFRPEVNKYIERRKYFKSGAQRLAHQRAFSKLIVRLIRNEIINQFPSYNPEEILLLTDPSLLDMLSEGYLFEIENYLTKEGTNVDQSKNQV